MSVTIGNSYLMAVRYATNFVEYRPKHAWTAIAVVAASLAAGIIAGWRCGVSNVAKRHPKFAMATAGMFLLTGALLVSVTRVALIMCVDGPEYKLKERISNRFMDLDYWFMHSFPDVL